MTEARGAGIGRVFVSCTVAVTGGAMGGGGANGLAGADGLDLVNTTVGGSSDLLDVEFRLGFLLAGENRKLSFNPCV